NHPVPYRYTVADNTRILIVVHVQHAVVLNAGLVADPDIVHIASNGHSRPHAGTLANDNVADYLCADVDISRFRDARHQPAKGSNHWGAAKRAAFVGAF